MYCRRHWPFGGKFNSAVSMPAINVNLGKPKVVPVALILIPQLHWITFLRVIFIIKALGNGWVEEYLK